MPDRKHLSTRGVVLLVLALVALGAGGAGGWALTHRGLPDGVVARVAGHDITRADLDQRAPSMQALYGIEPPKGAKLKQFWRDLTKAEVLSVVVEDAATDRGLRIRDEQVASSLNRYVGARYGAGAEGAAAFAQALADAGTSERIVRAEVRRQLVVSALYDEITDRVEKPTAKEISAAYLKRKCAFELGPRRQLANIVTATRDDAAAARARLEGGEPFGAVAREVSLDASTADTGGALGLLEQDQLESAYGREAFGASVGQLFGPVKTRYGWNVGRVEAARPASVEPLSTVSASLADALVAEAKSRVWRTWITDQLQKADAEYAAAYRPADPDAPPSDLSGDSATGSTKSCFE